jgi:transcriptional regulator with XRE-family HTH domain
MNYKISKDDYIPTEIILQTKEETAFLVSQAIKKERIYQKITQKELALKCFTNLSKIRRFEQTGDIDLKTFLLILSKLDLKNIVESMINIQDGFLDKSTFEFRDRILSSTKQRVRS